MSKLWSAIEGFLNPYMRYLEYAVLALVFYAGHYATVVWYDAQRAGQQDRVIEAIPQIIEKTRTITKVVHDSKDTCVNNPIPDAILNELRKQ